MGVNTNVFDTAGRVKCCYMCEDREVGCHSTCSRYIEEKQLAAEEKAAVEKKKRELRSLYRRGRWK